MFGERERGEGGRGPARHGYGRISHAFHSSPPPSRVQQDMWVLEGDLSHDDIQRLSWLEESLTNTRKKLYVLEAWELFVQDIHLGERIGAGRYTVKHVCIVHCVCVCVCACFCCVCVFVCVCACSCVCVCVCIVRACAWCVCVVQCILACVTYLAPHQPLPFSSPSTILSTHRSFGAVYAGTFRGDPVAIKTLKSNMRSHMRDEFFQEADIMKYNDKDWGREEVALHAVVVRTNGGQLLACFCERSVPWLRVNTGRHRQTHRHFVHALCWTVPVSAVSEHSSTPMFLGLLVL